MSVCQRQEADTQGSPLKLESHVLVANDTEPQDALICEKNPAKSDANCSRLSSRQDRIEYVDSLESHTGTKASAYSHTACLGSKDNAQGTGEKGDMRNRSQQWTAEARGHKGKPARSAGRCKTEVSAAAMTRLLPHMRLAQMEGMRATPAAVHDLAIEYVLKGSSEQTDERLSIALQVLERADPSRITDMLVETVCELLSEGPSDPDMLDMVTFEPMTYPVMLSTGFVLDYHTVLRLDRCPFTRKQFEYPLKVYVPPHLRSKLYEWRQRRFVHGVQVAACLARDSLGKRRAAVSKAISAIEELCFGNRNVVSVRFYPADVKAQMEALKKWAMER
mmetsp:Transcript_23171/g.44258  ORF Transcript_23171/g.44258 Transcript_23171/m.44258 type:complete len:334 (-) Transcript_23171:194-1195(-)